MSFVTNEKVLRIVAGELRMLSSSNDGDRVAATHALERTLKSAGSDLHALADHVEHPNGKHIPEEEMRRLYDAGFAAGVQAAENRQHGSDDFRGTDGKPTWEAVAFFLQRNKSRLDSKHHEFVDDMAARTAWGHEPTERQHRYLHGLFFKLGGKIT